VAKDGGGLFLGRTAGDPGDPVLLDPADLATHGVVVALERDEAVTPLWVPDAADA